MINDELKQYIIDFIDGITDKLYYHKHEAELSRLRKKYIYKDICREELVQDHNRLCEIKKVCEYYTMMLYTEIENP